MMGLGEHAPSTGWLILLCIEVRPRMGHCGQQPLCRCAKVLQLTAEMLPLVEKRQGDLVALLSNRMGLEGLEQERCHSLAAAEREEQSPTNAPQVKIPKIYSDSVNGQWLGADLEAVVVRACRVPIGFDRGSGWWFGTNAR